MRTLLLGLSLLIASVAQLAAQPTDYVVGPQDVLSVTVFGEAELTGKYTVDQDGTFTFPQIGRLKAAGLTLRRVEQELKVKLADGYLKNPQVAVSIETYRSQRILIMGEVRSPGEYQLNGEMTLLAAIARAGSTTTTAGHEATIVRPKRNPKPGEEPTEIIKVDLLALQDGNMALNLPLLDGDTLNIAKAQSVFVAGQVKSPGAYAVDPGATVLQVLSLAGGLTDRGSDNRIRIQRTEKGKKVEISAKLTDIVKPGDTVIVRERFF
jgi:polysaccharide export outer membrane protein